MRVDSHQHFWDSDRFAYPWMPPAPSPLPPKQLPEDLGPILRENRMDGSVVVQATTDSTEVDWLLDLADRHSFILGVVGWVDLADPHVGRRLDSLQGHPKFKGVRHPIEDEPDDRWLLRDEVVRGLKELERRRIPYDLLVRTRHLPVVRELVDRVPGLPLVIDHMAKPPIASGSMDGWAQEMDRLSQVPHIHVKMSGLVTEADRKGWVPEHLRPYIHHVFKCFSPDRLMFGTDWPVCKLAGATWKRTLATFTQACGAIPSPARAQIIGETAARFYTLVK